MGNKVQMGLIGLGNRGKELLKTVFLEHPDVEFAAVCDKYEDRCREAVAIIEGKGMKSPKMTTDYREVLRMPEIDAVIICTSWETHIEMCIEAMKAGKYAGIEVGGAYSIRECWKLVEVYEQTGVPVMFMENCVYGRDEMMIANMVQLGVLGEIVHCEGGYCHDLREEISFGRENRHYRLSNYIHRNTENYPTHELGPIARILHINRGNRMLTVSAKIGRASCRERVCMFE